MYLKDWLGRTWSRREFLQGASAATMTALTAGFPRTVFGSTFEKIPARADSVIVLWIAGGMAHTETFDPKRYVPFKPGQFKNDMLCTFASIDSSVDNIKISKGLEEIASIMDRTTLIRSFSPPDLGHILHARHQYHWHTGYPPPQTIPMPHIGAVIARTLGPLNPDVPAYIDIGQRLDIEGADELKAFMSPGFLGSEFGPLHIPYPDQALKSMSPPPAMNPSRFENRQKFYKSLVAQTPVGEFGSDYQRDSLLRSMDNAHRLISSPAAKAFDLTAEPAESYSIYNTGRFGLGCLLARRLVDVGARFIEVSTEHIPFGNWDTHVNGNTRTRNLKKLIDAPIAQLIRDLDKSGRLERTMIILASEFSRMAIQGASEEGSGRGMRMMSKDQWGMHRHFDKAGSILLAGGGTKRGFLYGKSNDEQPCQTIESPVITQDLHATMYHALGIPADLSYEAEKRPIYVTDNGEGKPVMDLFAKATV